MNKNETTQLNAIKNFYDSTYYQSIKIDKIKPSRHFISLAHRIGIQKEMYVLDVACGTGQWLYTCKELGANIAGVDLSEKAIEICKRYIDNTNFYESSAETLPFPNNQFDIVTCLGSLEHFVNQKKALQEMLRVAKKEAIFLILVPNKDFLTRKVGLFSGTNQVDAKEDVKTLQEWQSLFEDSGLIVNERWKDLHIFSWHWILSKHFFSIPLRILQALALTVWPLKWQYQVYHLCSKSSAHQ